jgi:hypothetical protein
VSAASPAMPCGTCARLFQACRCYSRKTGKAGNIGTFFRANAGKIPCKWLTPVPLPFITACVTPGLIHRGRLAHPAVLSLLLLRHVISPNDRGSGYTDKTRRKCLSKEVFCLPPCKTVVCCTCRHYKRGSVLYYSLLRGFAQDVR